MILIEPWTGLLEKEARRGNCNSNPEGKQQCQALLRNETSQDCTGSDKHNG